MSRSLSLHHHSYGPNLSLTLDAAGLQPAVDIYVNTKPSITNLSTGIAAIDQWLCFATLSQLTLRAYLELLTLKLTAGI